MIKKKYKDIQYGEPNSFFVLKTFMGTPLMLKAWAVFWNITQYWWTFGTHKFTQNIHCIFSPFSTRWISWTLWSWTCSTRTRRWPSSWQTLSLGTPWMGTPWSAWMGTYRMISLKHWGWDNIATISQTTFSNSFSWKKMYEFYQRFHLSFFLTIFRHWFS